MFSYSCTALGLNVRPCCVRSGGGDGWATERPPCSAWMLMEVSSCRVICKWWRPWSGGGGDLISNDTTFRCLSLLCVVCQMHSMCSSAHVVCTLNYCLECVGLQCNTAWQTLRLLTQLVLDAGHCLLPSTWVQWHRQRLCYMLQSVTRDHQLVM